MPKYPDVEVQLSGEDGNVFLVIGRVERALKREGLYAAAREFNAAAHNAQSYDEVIQLAMDTVDVS
jgi:hypothetical protein